ncbi:hypothetical protein C8R46DRAFT_1226742 [Mycena filopes]|nr:hypothetical protein C8R46DRAFT_1226742 [Mycena filopes]
MTVCAGAEVPTPVVPAHPHLQTFILCIIESQALYLGEFLAMITLPALRTFHSSEPAVAADGGLAALVDFVSRSQCELEELRIDDATLTERDYNPRHTNK